MRHDTEALVMIGKSIVCCMPSSNICYAFITMIALHYLLDLDYPKASECSFTIFQWLLFGDPKTPPDIIKSCELLWREFHIFKCPEEIEHSVNFKLKHSEE